MGSVAGGYPCNGGNVYGCTKAFVKQFSLGLRSDLQGTGVRVTKLHWVARLPAHPTVNRLEPMPVRQSFAVFQIHRQTT
ncbi:SDR family NAD(P)-dependent oxidoreductase [Azospirillum melinis]|uniref:SDR family NAD(P)-dependent oxidoreductase n=1 Tax=Azospirillum melinis TaxID=328839 RepID=UPI00375761A8